MSKYVLFINEYNKKDYNYYNLGDYDEDEINIKDDVLDSFKNANFDIEDYLDLLRNESFAFDYQCPLGCDGYGFHIFVIPKEQEYINFKLVEYKVSYQDTTRKFIIHDNRIIDARFFQSSHNKKTILKQAKTMKMFDICGDKFNVVIDENIKIKNKIPKYDYHCKNCNKNFFLNR